VNGQVPRGVDPTLDRYRAPLEARVGVRAHLWSSLYADLGAGAGVALESGYGREAFRVFGGLRWDYTFGDRDGDGVPDGSDRCPDVPAPGTADGCPTAGDSDGDGIPDGEDKCPLLAGTAELDGCPDGDGDGIPDNEDGCPTRAGTAENNGCPVDNPPYALLRQNRIELRAGITFDTGKDTIKSASFPVLDEVAALLLAHPELTRVRVEGHTDNKGGAVLNKDLSGRRAQSVVRYLINKGVGAERLFARGYGEERPIASNKNALGRAKNRRVEFRLLEQGAPEEAP
jgi:outer membrane protein OmpA-like peptidoglycan-associated protein